MRIKKIHLVKTKRFEDLTIDLGDKPKRIVALIGPNGCGKSGIFDAIVLLNSHKFKQIGNTGVKDINYYSLNNQIQFNIKNIDIVFDDNRNFNEVANEYSVKGMGNTIISFRSPYRYSGNLKVKEMKSVSDIANNQYGAASSSDVDQRMEETYRRLYAKYYKYLEDNDLRPSEAKEYIIAELNKSLMNCLNLRIDSIGDINGNKGTIYFKKTDYSTSFEYNLLSSGEKEVVDIILDLYLRKDVYKDTIYLIDEPELHINTSIQRQLLIEINKIIPDNCQIWIATHSIGFMRALQVDFPNESQIIKFDADKKWASESYTLYPIVPSRKEWLNIFETAVDDLAELISPERIVYCEGEVEAAKDNEEQGFDAKVYNTIFYEEYPDTVFVSSGGNTLLEPNSRVAINILSKVYKVIDILILKDLDSNSGKPVDLEFRNLYLSSSPKNHKMLSRYEIENYLYDKEVLNAYCVANGKEFNENMYDSIVSDVVLDDVKSKTNDIKKCCGLDENINTVKFKLELAKMIVKETNVYKELKKIIFNN